MACLNVVRHTVEVNVPATSIPDGFEIDLEPFDVGDSINISSVDLPDDVEPTITDRDFTIATIATPAALRSDGGEDEDEVDEEATEAEGEEAEGEGEE